MEEQSSQQKKASLLHDLKPKSRREWIKFFVNLLIVIFFIYVLWYASFSFREGYDTGMAKCMGSHAANWTINMTNNISILPA